MSKAIICFEGPSGIGKTTLCNVLSDDFTTVSEVNLLFKRDKNEPKYWYHEKQVERYKLCKMSHNNAILDGDVFQPIWYNWACGYPSSFLSKQDTHDFYRNKITEGKIAFPDLYIVFQIDEKELWIRKEKDKTRQRRNFEKHLKIIEPLKDYYKFLDQETALEIQFVNYEDIEDTKRKVLSLIENLPLKKVDSLETFKQIEHWINKH